ncbi:MAG: PilT/PilU family type 4a pilus ATPase [Fidelibacterota bacterium]
MYQIEDLLKVMIESEASDLFVSLGTFPMLMINGKNYPIEKEKITPEILNELKQGMLTKEQMEKFERNLELDYNYSLPGVGRFRINFFRQRNSDSFVIRRITSEILSLDQLNLPPILGELVLKKQGLILVVGSTGSGKTTTLAAMIDHRNSRLAGHILTLEDPIEFLHQHKKSLVNQREIGVDSSSYEHALKSALREAPSLLLIGEVRDQSTMSAALNFAETGHLVLSTLHATNASQCIERVMSFFDRAQAEMARAQLSSNLQAVIAQRLVPTLDGNRVAAMELLLTTARVRDLIGKGDIELLRHTIEESTTDGMQLFDQALLKLFQEGRISEDTAIRYADRPTDLKLQIRSQEKHTTTQVIELSED